MSWYSSSSRLTSCSAGPSLGWPYHWPWPAVCCCDVGSTCLLWTSAALCPPEWRCSRSVGGESIHIHLNRWLHIHQQSEASLLTVPDRHEWQCSWTQQWQIDKTLLTTQNSAFVEEQCTVYTESSMKRCSQPGTSSLAFLYHPEYRQGVGFTLKQFS